MSNRSDFICTCGHHAVKHRGGNDACEVCSCATFTEEDGAMAKSNGKDDGVEVIHGKAPKKRGKKLAGKAPRDTKTAYLPGQEPVKDRKVHRLIEEYNEIKLARMALTEKEVAAKANPLAAMKEAGLEHYAVDGREADIIAEETVKARIAPEEAEAAEERELSGGPRRHRESSRGAEARA